MSNRDRTRKGISPLGRRLMAIRHEIEHSDIPLLSDSEVERELRKRAGGTTPH